MPVEHVSKFSDEMAEKLAAEPFELNGNLLFRFRIFVTDSGTCLFSLFHHLIVDGGSLNLVFSDIAAAYNGQPMSVEKCDGYKLSEMENEAEESSAPAYDVENRDISQIISLIRKEKPLIGHECYEDPSECLISDTKFS